MANSILKTPAKSTLHGIYSFIKEKGNNNSKILIEYNTFDYNYYVYGWLAETKRMQYFPYNKLGSAMQFLEKQTLNNVTVWLIG